MQAQLASTPLQILLIEDEADIADPIADVLCQEGHRVAVAYDGDRGMERLRSSAYDLLISDVRLPAVDGLTLFQWVREHAPATAVILMSAYGSIPEAVSTLRQNAFHYLHKPFDVEELLRTVEQVAEQALIRGSHGIVANIADPIESTLIGQSAPMVALKRRLATLASSDAPLLIHGETGTGKEVVARAIHAASPRRDGPFIAINCGAFPDTLIESELFGHERGAFTGAAQRREGRFIAASGGTLFLDEVSEMSASSQIRLLRVLQENAFEPLGSNSSQKVDARILSATNADVRTLLRSGRFREDLFYRLRVLDAAVPPLRSRREDLPLLVGHFLRRHGPDAHNPPRISPCAWALLREYSFPGNVRELEHAIQHALVLSRGGMIDLQHLPDEIRGVSSALPAEDEPLPLAEAVRRFEREVISRTLEQTGGSRTRAAGLLGITRKSLWEKVKRLGIEVPPRSPPDER
jgi:DNA-binding NtrC family response regulator